MKKKITYIAIIGLLVWSTGLFAQNQLSGESPSKSMEEAPLLDIYPNPVVEYLNITQQQFDGSVSQLEIIDLSGHTVYEINETFTQLSIYVGNWQKGIYMVFFRQGDSEVRHKIVVN